MSFLSSVPSLPGPHRAGSTGRRVGIVSTFPPQLCGLATFAAALGNGLRRGGHVVDMVRIEDPRDAQHDNDSFAGILVHGSDSIAAGRDGACRGATSRSFSTSTGSSVASTATRSSTSSRRSRCRRSSCSTPCRSCRRHTSRSVLEKVCALAERVVVMTDTARRSPAGPLHGRRATVVTIPHGATIPSPQPTTYAEARRPELLTWGLLGPGKGIEHVIDALALLAEDGIRARVHVRRRHPSEGLRSRTATSIGTR